MTMRTFLRVAAAAAAGLLTLTAATATAGAAEITDAISMSWDGKTFAPTTKEVFFQIEAAVPGDTETRTLIVRNDGPGPGTLTADLVDVRAWPQWIDRAPDPNLDILDDPYYRDLKLDFGDGPVPFVDLVGEATRIREVRLKPGEATKITLSYDFPYSSVEGNRADGGYSRWAEVNLLLTIKGEEAAAPPSKDPRPPKLVDGGIPWLTSTTAVAWTGAGLLALTAVALLAVKARRRDDA